MAGGCVAEQGRHADDWGDNALGVGTVAHAVHGHELRPVRGQSFSGAAHFGHAGAWAQRFSDHLEARAGPLLRQFGCLLGEWNEDAEATLRQQSGRKGSENARRKEHALVAWYRREVARAGKDNRGGTSSSQPVERGGGVGNDGGLGDDRVAVIRQTGVKGIVAVLRYKAFDLLIREGIEATEEDHLAAGWRRRGEQLGHLRARRLANHGNADGDHSNCVCDLRVRISEHAHSLRTMISLASHVRPTSLPRLATLPRFGTLTRMLRRWASATRKSVCPPRKLTVSSRPRRRPWPAVVRDTFSGRSASVALPSRATRPGGSGSWAPSGVTKRSPEQVPSIRLISPMKSAT